AAYMFIYSDREGTPAANHFQDIPRHAKVERLTRLVSLSKEVSCERNQRWVGRTVEVLIKGPADEPGHCQGHTRGNHVTVVAGSLGAGLYQAGVNHPPPTPLSARPA